MSLATVYRIENNNGVGPYTGGGLLVDLQRTHGVNTWDRPCPSEDRELRGEWGDMHPLDRELYIFGFKSLQQAKDWLGHPGVGQDLGRCGFHIAVIKVPAKSVIYGEKQVVFPMSTAIRTKRLPAHLYRQ